MSDVALAEMSEAANLDAIDAGLDELDDLEFELEAAEPEVETVVEVEEPIEDVTIVDDVSDEEAADVAEMVEAAQESVEAEPADEVDAALAAADELADLDLAPDDEAAIDRMEAYDEQEASGDFDVEAAQSATKTKPKAKKTRAGGGTRAPKKDVNTIDPEFFVLGKEPDDLAQNKVDVIAKRPTQVKIAEKFDNLFAAVSSKTKPSRYTTLAYEFLKGKGEMVQKDLVAHYTAQGLGAGTASAQAGQLMNLFAVVQIANRDGKSLKINPDSKLNERLNEILSA